jgi:hypothetical protein
MLKHLFLFTLLSFSVLLQGQNTVFYSLVGKNMYELTQKKVVVSSFFSKNNFSKNNQKNIEKSPFSNTTYIVPTQARYYCYDKLAFFCKLEVKLERQFHTPIKFRLGDVQYVDWLEGK